MTNTTRPEGNWLKTAAEAYGKDGRTKHRTVLGVLCIGTALALGVAAEANGILMLASPEGWYFAVPGVTTTGPFNQHFVRDIGLIFLFIGTAFLAGTALPRHRIVLWLVPTLWLWGHALFHFWEVAVGICGPSAIARDFPAVTLPAIIATVLTLWAIYEGHADERARARF